MATLERMVLFGVLSALLLTTWTSALLEVAASDGEAPETGLVYQPNVDKSMHDPNAQDNSPLRGFWDSQTKQAMDANISNELDRRRAEGWTGEGGNVVKAMGELRDGAKEGSHVDAEQLKREAAAARAKVLRGVGKAKTSLEDAKKKVADGQEGARGEVVRESKKGQDFLNALKAKEKDEAAAKVAKEQQRVEKLRDEGNFMRKHPSEAAAASPAA